MSTNKLSPPIQFEGSNIQNIIMIAFQNFNLLFGQKQTRPTYKGFFIFFNTNKSYGGHNLTYPERFMHSVSIEDKIHYTAFPCNNDISYELCTNKCDCSKALTEFQYLMRGECPYRLARVHWIPEIIKLANQNDPNVKSWTQIETDIKKRVLKKHYIRYESGIYDYVIILKEEWENQKLKMYTFITGFPVFLKRNKIQFDKNYQDSKKGTVILTVP
jgi:hypothetical protein